MARMTIAQRQAREDLDRMFERHQQDFRALSPAQQDVYRRAFRANGAYEEKHQFAMRTAVDTCPSPTEVVR